MFLVNSQDELLPTWIEEPDFIANGLQVKVVVKHASVFCENMREERVIVKLDETARKADPDAFATSELFRILQEL